MKHATLSVRRLAIAIVTGAGLVGWALVTVPLWQYLYPVIPREISDRATFELYYPARSAGIRIDPASFEYDSVKPQVSFNVYHAGQDISLAEQIIPSQFDALPDYYEKFLKRMGCYAEIRTRVGPVNLCHPAETKQQVAILKGHGTLVFAQSGRDILEGEWRELFDTFVHART